MTNPSMMDQPPKNYEPTGPRYYESGEGDRAPSPFARGTLIFGGALMLVAGVFQALEGIQALDHGDVFFQGPRYSYDFNVTTWGWIHLILGVVVALTGLGVLLNRTIARVFGIIVVILSMASNFMFLPQYPLWTIVIIGLDILILWALVTAPERH